MDLLNVFSFMGGVALFLFGMHLMGDAIRRQAGGKFRSVLEKLTSSRLRGLLLGTGVAAVIQSSSAVSVMVLGFINSGIMDLESALSLIMGANIGTCVTAWLLSLNSISGGTALLKLISPSSFVPVLALVGACLQLFSHNNRRKDAGLILLGFSVLMYGMDHMSEALAPFTDSGAFQSMITLFSNPFMGLLLGFAMTALTQSSSASVGILQAVSAAADIRFRTAFPIILGINVGATIIVLVSSVGGNKDSKRAALLSFLYNLIGAIVFLPLWLLTDRLVPVDISGAAMGYVSVAISHTAYKSLLAALLLPFVRQLCRLSRLLIPADQNENRFQLLDERFLQTPAVAVGWCQELANDMALMTRDALDQAMELAVNYDEREARTVIASEEACDMYEDKLGSYIVKLSQTRLADRDSRSVTKILHCLSDMERISDHAVSIVKAGQEMKNKGLEFSPVALEDLQRIIDPVREIVSITINAFLNDDSELAGNVEPLEQVVDMLITQVKDRHVARLQGGECTILRGFIFSDLLTNLSRVSDHCSNIAVCVIEMQHDSFDTHEYLNAKKTSDKDFDRMFGKYADKYGFKDR